MSRPCFSLNGWGLNRETQSIEFLSAPGNEKLYSGALMTMASLACTASRRFSAPAGKPSSAWRSASYEGASKSRIAAK